jgi:hypothetical protein
MAGITVYLLNGGLLEYAQQMAAHESARTTKLYDPAAMIRSHSIRSNESFSEGCFHSNRSLEPS